MGVKTFEGVIEQGQVKFITPVSLPDRTKVYVVVPDAGVHEVARVHTPRLARPEQATDFQMEVIQTSPDDSLR